MASIGYLIRDLFNLREERERLITERMNVVAGPLADQLHRAKLAEIDARFDRIVAEIDVALAQRHA